jgi:fructokinase
VVDTVGAGDSWTGGLLAALHRDGVVSAGAVRDLPEDRLAELVDEALLVAALTCGRAGADPPTRAELRAAQ